MARGGQALEKFVVFQHHRRGCTDGRIEPACRLLFPQHGDQLLAVPQPLSTRHTSLRNEYTGCIRLTLVADADVLTEKW